MTRSEAIAILFESPPTRLSPELVQSAFARKIKDLHPDLHPSGGGEAADISRVLVARDVLRTEALRRTSQGPAVSASGRQSPMRAAPPRSGRRQGSAASAAGKNSGSRSASGVNRRQAGPKGTWVPHRQLRFGQYLYYRGVISWNALIESIVAQRGERSGFGALAVEAGFLSSEQVSDLRLRFQPGRFIGQTAVEFGYMTEDQVRMVLEIQARKYRPLGHIMVERGIISLTELARYIRDHRAHNLGFEARSVDGAG